MTDGHNIVGRLTEQSFDVPTPCLERGPLLIGIIVSLVNANHTGTRAARCDPRQPQ